MFAMPSQWTPRRTSRRPSSGTSRSIYNLFYKVKFFIFAFIVGLSKSFLTFISTKLKDDYNDDGDDYDDNDDYDL